MIFAPITQIGFLINLSLPQPPEYLVLDPADQSLTRYSNPKKNTRNISWGFGGDGGPYHPEEGVVGELCVFLDGGEHAEYEADQHHQEPGLCEQTNS